MNRLRLGGDDGIALVVVVLVMAVLSISVVSLVAYTSASSRDASSKRSGQGAYSLAEAGVNHALAQIASHYYDAAGSPINNTTAGSGAWTTSGSQQSPSSTTACIGTSSCVTWTSTWTPVTTGITKGTWQITAVGSTPNPTGAGVAAVTRTVHAKINVEAPPESVSSPGYWQMVYSGRGPTNGCDMTLGQGVTFKSPVYVAGNLCLGQNGAVESPGTLTVGGWVDTGQNGHIGLSTSPVSNLEIVGSCLIHSMVPPCTLVNIGGVWTNGIPKNGGGIKNDSIDASAFSNTIVTPLSPPAMDLAMRYTESYPSSCTTSPTQTPQPKMDGAAVPPTAANGDAGTFDLAPSYAYTCTQPSGSLVWDPSTNPDTLTVTGNVYIDGDLSTSNNTVLQDRGIGGIFVTGGVSFGNNTKICGSGVGNDCSNPRPGCRPTTCS